jgi:adenosylcobinamide kinase/adenosylcobinamide-phosphate guanylyltransferase
MAVAPDPRVRPSVRGHRTLVLGGARSGKSWYAEQLLADRDQVTYVATGGTRPDDAEWVARVAEHRARRPAGWRTVETADVTEALTAAGDEEVLLVDCLALWLAAVLDAAGAWADDSPTALAEVDERSDTLLAAWTASPAHVVAVSNEVGSGVVPATRSGRVYRDLLGRLNARVAAASDDVVVTVAGVPWVLKQDGRVVGASTLRVGPDRGDR